MNQMIALCRGALALETLTFSSLKQSPDVFRKGFTLVLVIGLIVGLVTGVVGTVTGLMTDPATQVTQARQGFEDWAKSFTVGMPEAASRQMFESVSMGFRIGERVVKETKAPLPWQFETIFQQLGVIVSYPFGWLGSLLFYGALVHIFAKLLGGRATIAQMLGVTSLTVVPHLLDALGFIPCLGGLLGLVAFVWGAVIYVKATAVAQEMPTGRALLAVLLPIIVGLLIALLLLLLLGVLIAAGGGK